MYRNSVWISNMTIGHLSMMMMMIIIIVIVSYRLCFRWLKQYGK